MSPSGVPLAATRGVRPVNFNMIRQIPSLTQPERQQINYIERALNRQVALTRSGVTLLQQKLDDKVKANAPQDEQRQLKADIAEMNASISQAQKDVISELMPVLTNDQWHQYDAMKHGELIITPEMQMQQSK